jgi:hypothetical protein
MFEGEIDPTDEGYENDEIEDEPIRMDRRMTLDSVL